MRFAIHVIGRPAPQGSKSRGAAGQLREQSAYLPAWRQAVKRATYLAYRAANVEPEDLPLLRGAVKIDRLTFRLDPTSRVDGPPDIDKLTRATLDALTQARAFEDDARVVEIRRLGKRHTLPGEQPGADIIISTLHEEDHEESDVKRYRLNLIELNDDPTEDDTEIVSVTGGADVIAVVLPHVGATLGADRASVVMPAAGSPPVNGGPVSATAPAANDGEAPKRKRRTKAEMAEAARAAGSGAAGEPPAPPAPAPAATLPPGFAAPAGAPAPAAPGNATVPNPFAALAVAQPTH